MQDVYQGGKYSYLECAADADYRVWLHSCHKLAGCENDCMGSVNYRAAYEPAGLLHEYFDEFDDAVNDLCDGDDEHCQRRANRRSD